MTKLTIASFNLRNHYWDHNWDGEDFPIQLANFIRINDINFLGTQELVKKYSYKLQKELGPKYSVNGSYRYGKIPLIDQFNESNAIITDKLVLKTKTNHLATIPFIDHLAQMPRIMTSVETTEHFMINTHLEYWNEYSQKHQLKVLYKYIVNHLDKKPIITGDFNMDYNKKYFLEFIEALKKLGINHIDNNTPTYATTEQILDHIFLPDNYEIANIEVIQNQSINQISDHRPFLVKARKK